MEPGTPSRGVSRRMLGCRLAASLGLGLALLATGIGLVGGPAGPLRGLAGGAVLAAAGPSASQAPTARPTAPPPSPSPIPPPAQTPIPAAALQARLNAIRVQYHVPGVSATIIWPDGRSWTGVNGWADVKQHVPVAPTTAFSVGSVSKTFLAALVLQLADEGRLSLDDPVLRWLPAAAVPADATIRELLDHTSGLYDFFSNPAIDTALLANRRQAWTPARALGYMRAPYCAAGTCWHYSNSNYVLLGQVVQQVTGNPVATELRRRFFAPLRLVRTFVQGAEAARGTVATSYEVLGSGSSTRTVSQGDGTAISPFTSVVTAAGSAGAIAATSRDLAVWARRIYGGAILRPAALAAMLDVSHSVGAGSALPYGLGVEEVSLGGRLTEGHNGRLIGAGATMRYLPDSGFSIAVVTNQDRVSPDVFAAALLAIAFPPPPTPSPSPSPQPVPVPTPSGP
ncbi:MAG TPA: serine hydrolase domain-containing protein [Verrucomicrobiae bacterium]|nr:serine hydrolase domain-containing protein [Verrucomicrobiae bacterium]